MTFHFENISVLVVEDTAPMLKIIASILDNMGFGSVYTATNGEAGFKKFRTYNPDFVIVDAQMDPMNGIALTKEIRTNTLSPNRTAHIILISGYSSFKDVAKARDAGVTEFLVKPFSASDLAKRITYIIKNPRGFIDSPNYFGPDRRRKSDPKYDGKLRRENDAIDFK